MSPGYPDLRVLMSNIKVGFQELYSNFESFHSVDYDLEQ